MNNEWGGYLMKNNWKNPKPIKPKTPIKQAKKLLIGWTLSSSGEKSDPYLGWTLQSYD